MVRPAPSCEPLGSGATVAQLTLDQKVEGSNPSSPANRHIQCCLDLLTCRVKESTERLMSAERTLDRLGHMPYQSAPDVFLSALSMRDFGRFAECLAPEVHARLLLPRGPEVRTGREEIARRFEGWFASASDFEVLDTQRAEIGLRTRLSWRLRMSRDGRSREVVEQVAFVDAEPDGISAIDLVCSGFQPEERDPGISGHSIMGGSSAPLEAVNP